MINDVKLFIDFINSGENFSFVKFGDGEFFCIRNMKGVNGDGHPYSSELGSKLLESLHFFQKQDDVYISRRRYHHSHLDDKFLLSAPFNETRWDIIIPHGDNNNQVIEFYKAIKASKRKKIIVAPQRLINVFHYLSINHFIEVSLVNCYKDYDQTLAYVKDKLEDDCIVLTSCGMMAKVLAHDLLIYNRSITIIDTGSVFDSLCGYNTRWYDLPTSDLKNLFLPLA